MKEIGGYFELEKLIDEPYYKDLIELNTGRNALIYLVLAKKIDKLFLPYYLCATVSNILDEYGVKLSYYHIDREFLPILNNEIKTNEYLYVVNYYGQISNNQILELNNRYKNVIIDNTQSFFQKPLIDIDTIYTCRKYFGVSDGAYLSTNSRLNEELKTDNSYKRMKHILGRFEGPASEYYEDFRANDELLKHLSIKKMSKLTRNILGAIDYAKALESRNRNFSYLSNELNLLNGLNIKKPKGPFAYPFYTKNGIRVRKELAERKIYIPILWPNVLKENDVNTVEYDFAANILPLPCDQRYGVEDMDIIIKELKKCLKISECI